MRVGEQACFGSPTELGFVLKSTTKLRVAVGVFHQFERLLDTINGLTAEGFSESDLVLLCDYNALEICRDGRTKLLQKRHGFFVY